MVTSLPKGWRADLVVTRHPALREFLMEQGLCGPDCPVLAHADAGAIRGKHVAGVLPLHLAAETASVATVDLALPAELRGSELTVAQVREFATGIRAYTVRPLS